MPSSDQFYADKAREKAENALAALKDARGEFVINGIARDVDYLFGPHAPGLDMRFPNSDAEKAVAQELHDKLITGLIPGREWELTRLQKEEAALLADRDQLTPSQELHLSLIEEAVSRIDRQTFKELPATQREAVKTVSDYLSNYLGAKKAQGAGIGVY